MSLAGNPPGARIRRVKILRLTNSNDVLSTTNRPEALRQGLEQFLGEPVEIVVKTIWPTETLPETVEKWVAREQPDLVWVGLVNYWYGRQKKLKSVSIGTVWRPKTDGTAVAEGK